MKNEILKIENLSKTYFHKSLKVEAVKNLSLSLGEGEIVCIFGRSGSGKTTLLNLMGALDRPDAGRIFISGKNLGDISGGKMPLFRRKNIGFVFQYFNLVPHLTVLENTAMPLKFDGVGEAERRKRALEILSRLEMADRADFYMGELSGGQIQRAAFARAIINNPAIVLSDEPTGQLDSETAKNLADMIVDLNRRNKQTFIIATHDTVISSICHRIFYLKDGKITEKPSGEGLPG